MSAKRQARSSVLLTIRTYYLHATPNRFSGPHMTRRSQPPADADTATRPIPTSPAADAAGIIAVVMVGALVFALGWFKVASLDVGYHVAYGGQFLDTGQIVGRDPFLLPETAVPPKLYQYRTPGPVGWPLRDRVGITWTHLSAKRQARSSVFLTIRTCYFRATPNGIRPSLSRKPVDLPECGSIRTAPERSEVIPCR